MGTSAIWLLYFSRKKRLRSLVEEEETSQMEHLTGFQMIRKEFKKDVESWPRSSVTASLWISAAPGTAQLVCISVYWKLFVQYMAAQLDSLFTQQLCPEANTLRPTWQRREACKESNVASHGLHSTASEGTADCNWSPGELIAQSLGNIPQSSNFVYPTPALRFLEFHSKLLALKTSLQQHGIFQSWWVQAYSQPSWTEQKFCKSFPPDNFWNHYFSHHPQKRTDFWILSIIVYVVPAIFHAQFPGMMIGLGLFGEC